MLRSRFSRVLSLILTSVLIFSMVTSSVSAISSDLLQMFALNNIIGYDPDEDFRDPCGGGKMAGDTNFAKIVSYFSGNNSQSISMGAVGIAAIIANFQAESGLGPMVGQGGTLSSASDHGYGVAQFTPDSKITNILKSDSRTSDTFNTYYTTEYAHTLQSDEEKRTGVTDGVPVNVNDAWLEVELDFVAQGLNSTKVGDYRHSGGEMGLDYISDNMTLAEALEAATSAGDAARIFTWIYERPANKERDATIRAENVQLILPEVEELIGSTSSISNSNDGSNITIIGDSITERSKSNLLELMPEVEIYSQVGKQFYSANESSDNLDGYHTLKTLVDNGSLRSTLIYALGTNNAGLTQDEAKKVIELAGDNTTIIFVTNYGVISDYTSNNNVFLKMQNDYSNVKVADWAALAESNEGVMEDDVHPTIGRGTGLFAQLLYSTATDNFSNVCNSASGGNMDLNATALELSWPDNTHDKLDPKPEYTAALQAVGLSSYGEEWVKIGSSCDAFVATVLRYSGVDKDAYCCGAQAMLDYFASHPEKYEEIPNTGSESDLQPGDIRARSGHVEMYVVDDNGNGRIASASHADRTADHAGSFYQNSDYRIFRVKK